MTKKLDIMNERDLVAPGEVCKWQTIGGKVSKVEDAVEVKKETRVEGPTVKEGIKEIEVVEKTYKLKPKKIMKKEEIKWGR